MGCFIPLFVIFIAFVFSCCAPHWGGVLTFSVVQSTQCAPPIVCSCKYVGGFFVAPNLSFYIRFLNLYHHQYHSFAPPSLHPCLVFQQWAHLVCPLSGCIYPPLMFHHVFLTCRSRVCCVSQGISGGEWKWWWGDTFTIDTSHLSHLRHVPTRTYTRTRPWPQPVRVCKPFPIWEKLSNLKDKDE